MINVYDLIGKINGQAHFAPPEVTKQIHLYTEELFQHLSDLESSLQIERRINYKLSNWNHNMEEAPTNGATFLGCNANGFIAVITIDDYYFKEGIKRWKVAVTGEYAIDPSFEPIKWRLLGR
jgi:hypothetical protein